MYQEGEHTVIKGARNIPSVPVTVSTALAMPRKNNTADKPTLFLLTLVARIRTLQLRPVYLLNNTVRILLARDIKLILLALAILQLLTQDELVLALNKRQLGIGISTWPYVQVV